MLRITVNTSEGKVVLKLEGRLVGPWVDELRRSVLLANAWSQLLEIDVLGLTYAEKDGEEALRWLHKMGAHFQGIAPFPQYLFDRLEIPLLQNATVDRTHKSFADSRDTAMSTKRTAGRRKNIGIANKPPR